VTNKRPSTVVLRSVQELLAYRPSCPDRTLAASQLNLVRLQLVKGQLTASDAGLREKMHTNAFSARAPDPAGELSALPISSSMGQKGGEREITRSDRERGREEKRKDSRHVELSLKATPPECYHNVPR